MTAATTTDTSRRQLQRPRISHSSRANSRHLLDVDSLSLQDIEALIQSAEEKRAIIVSQDPVKSDTLRGRSIYTLFFENSTRTRVSFEHAGKALGADVINISTDASSVKKGESLLNTVLTLSAMKMDILIIRHPSSGAPNFVANHIDAPVINAGDGTHAHPTQALIDVMTLTQRLGNLHGAKVAIIGDTLHSRVARSDIIALNKMGAKITLAAPPTLLPHGWNPGHTHILSRDTDGDPIEVTVCHTVEDAIQNADAIIALRLQAERQEQGLLPHIDEYSRVWGIDQKRLDSAPPDVLVLHPGPMNEGVEISTQVAHGSKSLVQEQVTNGVAIRMAVLERYCDRDGENR